MKEKKFEEFSLYIPCSLYNEITEKEDIAEEELKEILKSYLSDKDTININYITNDPEENSLEEDSISNVEFFLDNPEIDTYIKYTDKKDNTYLHPRDIKYGYEIELEKDIFFNNYKMNFDGDRICCFGSVVAIPKEVEYSLDLKKDDSGTGIGLIYRIRDEKEREEDITKKKVILPNGSVIVMPGAINKQAKLSKECMEFLETEKFTKGYEAEEKAPIIQEVKEEQIQEEKVEKGSMSISKIILSRIKSIKQKKVTENYETQISRITKELEKSFEPNPYIVSKYPLQDKKFIINVEELEQKGERQIKLSIVLDNLKTSEKKEYYLKKYETIDVMPIRKSGSSGIMHSKRAGFLLMCILEYQGLMSMISDRHLDILLSAAYYHDIGKLSDIGPHALKSVKMIAKQKNMFKDFKITYADGKEYTQEDMNLLMCLVEGHELSNEKSLALSKKYNISQEDAKVLKKLVYVLKDALALDRTRNSTKHKSDLTISYLRYDSSRRLIKASYELETITRYVESFDNILKYIQ